MVEWSTVISLVLFGLLLLIAEIIFVPGTTVVGLVGFVFMVVGVALSFRYFGGEKGWTVVGVTAVASGVLLYLAFKANVWGKFALKSSSNSKVNEGSMNELTAGLEGTTLSALRPVGNADIAGKTFEVRTNGEYVERGTKIKIIKVVSNQIIVEPLT
jgi:membrane-bound ClpP family serine protease